MTFLAGNTGTATFNGVEVPVTGWNVNPSVDVVRFANSKTSGFRKKQTTYKDATFSVDMDYDFDSSPFAVSPGLTLGAVLTNVKLFLNGTSGKFWNFPSAICVSTPQRLDNEGKITTSANFEADGTFSPPT